MTNADRTGKDRGWRAVFARHEIHRHNFDESPYIITAADIKTACQHFRRTTEKEVRILCTQTMREMRPQIFAELGLFILPVRNGEYAIIRGEGYFDIPPITTPLKLYSSKLNFALDTATVGDSEMQHLDFAYAASMVRDFTGDSSLVLTIRGRKYTPQFSFTVGGFNITAESVQTEVDSGYEGRENVVLVEAKNTRTTNTIIRQLYYPFRQWGHHTRKAVSVLFFEKRVDEYHFWKFEFAQTNNYNSIHLVKSCRYRIR